MEILLRLNKHAKDILQFTMENTNTALRLLTVIYYIILYYIGHPSSIITYIFYETQSLLSISS